ncbi:glycosyltransferase family 87 protein, partial [Streptomyces exfoliatus]
FFAVLFWFTGRRRAAVAGGASFAFCTALAWAAMPHDSWTYWVHHVAGAGLGGNPDSLANQSLHGALLRFGLQGPLEIVLFLVLAVAVTVLGLRRAVRYAHDGQLLLAVAVTGCVA